MMVCQLSLLHGISKNFEKEKNPNHCARVLVLVSEGSFGGRKRCKVERICKTSRC